KRRTGDFSKSMSLFSLAAEFCCLFAPLTGVLLSENLSWRAPFIFVAIVTFFLLLKSSKILKLFVLDKLDMKDHISNMNYGMYLFHFIGLYPFRRSKFSFYFRGFVVWRTFRG